MFTDAGYTGNGYPGVTAITKARRTKAGMQAALAIGRWPFQAPLEYLNGGPNGRGALMADASRAPLVRTAFELYGSGRYTKTEVLRKITALGLTTRNGKALGAQSLGSLLRNPIYCGWLKVHDWNVSGRGDFEALVPEALFRRVQRLLDGQGDTFRPHSKDHPDFPLRRFVACGRCAAPLTGSWSKGRTKRYSYYHCRRCKGVSVRKEALEAHFLATRNVASMLACPEIGYNRSPPTSRAPSPLTRRGVK